MKGLYYWIVFALGLVVVSLCMGCAPATSRIKLDVRTVNNMNFLYDHVQTEFAFCVFGTVQENVIVVDHIELPYIYEAKEDMVRWDPCSGPSFLGIGHSHPRGAECVFSEQDFVSLLATNAPYGFLVCENQHLVWYSKREVAAKLQ